MAWVAASLGLYALAPAAALAVGEPAQEVKILYQKFKLDNGLTLIVHEDHKAPIVAVNVWYHVGSKNEKPGKTGFAHLFEHLMFNGSENFNDDYFKVLDRIGATDLNGTTSEDRTNYFQNVPTSALDAVLWMESDRMGHLLGAIDQARLDEQRGVVQNEKRQGENEPYSVSYELITKATYPAGHPYSWTVIGSMDDLNAASLKDVQEWFKAYYGAANATVVIAGDIDAAAALEKVTHYFGDIPPGPPVARHEVWIAPRTGTQRQRVEDRVPQARLYQVWNVPQWGSADSTYLNLVADALASGKTSRLYKRLVYDEHLATEVLANVDPREIGGQFNIVTTAQPGGDLAKIERAIGEELARFLAQGPTPEELERASTQFNANFTRGVERIGGFGGKSDLLAMGQVFAGNAEHYKIIQDRVAGAKDRDLQAAAKRWLADGMYVLEVHPFPEYAAAKTGADRSNLPEPGMPPAAEFPKLQRATLANGLEIVLAERHAVPVVDFDLLVDAGYAADQFSLPGTASLAVAMLDEGTKNRTSLKISEELAMLGARLDTDSNLDRCSVFLSALKARLDPSLDIFADVILNASFPTEDFDRLKKIQIAGIQSEKVSPIAIALRVFPKLLFGEGHAYSTPFTGSGYEDSVAKISRDDLVRFHTTWFKPNNARIVVTGDTTMAEIKPKLDALFKDWPKGKVPAKNINPVSREAGQKIYIVDRPGAIQSFVLAGLVAPPRSAEDEVAIETMNNILGGAFTARINMNLREDKHWSYGAGTFMTGTRGQRPFFAYAPVQTDKTKESMQEISKEIREYLGSKPATPEELKKSQDIQTRTLAGSWETIEAVATSIAEILHYGLPDDYFTSYPAKVRALKLTDVSAASRKVLVPDKLVWVVVGDRSKVEEGVRELGWGEVRYLDADGKPIR